MVGQVGIGKRLNQLRNELDETCKELGQKEYVKQALSDFLHISQATNEIKVLKRKRMDLKIRIKNLERELSSGSPRPSGSTNLSRASNSSFTKFLENGADDACQLQNGEDGHHGNDLDYDEIDFVDEYFDPEEEKSPHYRPFPEYAPSNSLPHSQRRFRHERRIGLIRDLNSEPRGLNTGLVDILGRFKSVEDEVEVDWSKMSIDSSMKYTFRKNRKNGYHYPLNPEVTIIKPKVENLVKNRKKSIVQVLRKLSENGIDVPSRDCICKRAPCSIVCSGKDCAYAFTGRLAAPCDLHPGDKYLMDHPPQCPHCRGSLVERDSDKNDIFNDSKPIIETPVVTSTPREKMTRPMKKLHENGTISEKRAISKKILHETLEED